MQFADIHGYQAIKQQFAHLARSGQMPHAVLLEIQEGYPGLHLAWAWAQYIQCQAPTDEDSCGVCASCKKVAAIAHPDVIFVYPVIKAAQDETPTERYFEEWRTFLERSPYITDQDWLEVLEAGNSQPVIYVNEINSLLSRLSITTTEGGWRTIIIYQPERMNDAAANKLLKSLEEPPEETLFILVSAHSERLLDTILSRVQRFELPPMTEEEMREALTAMHPDLASDVLETIIPLVDGNLSDALRLLDSSASQDKLQELAQQWYDATLRADILRLKLLSEEVDKMGREGAVAFLKLLTQQVGRQWHRALRGEARVGELRVNNKAMGACYRLLEEAIREIRGNVLTKMVLFDTFLRMLLALRQ